MMGKIKCLILALTVAASCAMAQLPAPAWLSQIKLSGLSGSADHRLAVINAKTFSAGEDNDLKLKGRTIHVQCLEIREESVLVQIQGLPGPYELTISGNITALNKEAAATPPQLGARISSPAPTPVSPINIFVPSQPIKQPSNRTSILSFGIPVILAGIFFALLAGLALLAKAVQIRHQRNLGEALVADAIGRDFTRPHHLLNNITLPTADGTTQIDHVLVADTGIFVIETKHYSGWVFGNAKDRQWTQTIFKKKSRFQNPRHQNYAHVKALQLLLGFPDNHFHSVVVFTGDAKFKTDLGSDVVQLAGLIPFLSAERPVLFDERKMASVIGRIEMKRERRSVETDEYHINQLRNRHGGQTSKPVPQATLSSPSNNSFLPVSGDEKYQPKA